MVQEGYSSTLNHHWHHWHHLGSLFEQFLLIHEGFVHLRFGLFENKVQPVVESLQHLQGPLVKGHYAVQSKGLPIGAP